MSTKLKLRRYILTGSVTAVTVTGALYGAGLKDRQEKKRIVQKRQVATPAEKIAILEGHREGLVAKRRGVEAKIAEVEDRRKRQMAAAAGGRGDGARVTRTEKTGGRSWER